MAGGDGSKTKHPTDTGPPSKLQQGHPEHARTDLQSDLKSESDDPTAKTSTPVLDEGPIEVVKRGDGKRPRFGAGGRVSETGDTPLSCMEPLTGPFSEDKPYIVAYADLVSRFHGDIFYQFSDRKIRLL